MYPAKWSDTFVDVAFRVIESISPRKFLASNSTVFSAYLLCLEFWQIDWCHIILSPWSWFSIFFEVLKRAHHSSGKTGPTSSPLDHSAVSLSKQTDIVHSEGCQIDSCDIVRYTDQCCIGLKGQSEFSTIGDLLMLPRAFKNLGLPSFNSVAFPSLSLQWNRAFELDIAYHTWTRWRKPAASLHSGSTFCLQQSCSAQILLEL